MNTLATSSYQTSSAVLFIIFNRPDTTERVFAQIRRAQPTRLYIAADGPRSLKPGEDILCERTRTIATNVDWPCEVKTLFREVNLGCKHAVSSAITWFFEQEEEGIVLEDDCMPNNDFFRFCDAMLSRYRDDTRIRHIGGANLQLGKQWGNASYYYSNMTHVWGWAGWRRVWNDYDKELLRYEVADVRSKLEVIFNDRFAVDTWAEIFAKVKAGEIDTWDYQYGFLNFFNNSLSVIPNQNLITNIGFGENSTHTIDANSPNANIPLQELGEIKHPLYVLPQKQADYFTLNQGFNLDYRWRRYNKTKRKLKRWVQNIFK
ncbi:nucleotide-diphospho-sugar transferase [Mucilaginibacter sp. RB4R14]|uniref:nucleotide-diphospho-sugar transferase n=1 Tax=Mucilaginibacter aurantiaciroseus TaxID=2949308 RepID=UPI0020914C5A|nr:nucleotide-diphospho-sugar transferase [Mucilaginibacter aurantiaciroseus]MCO5935621.1 nucleotide-diphospho-sugar transferase [Mucilaginibacter aurantiaciroseus]